MSNVDCVLVRSDYSNEQMYRIDIDPLGRKPAVGN